MSENQQSAQTNTSGGPSPLLLAGIGGGILLVVIVGAIALITIPRIAGGFDTLNADNPSVSHPDGITVTVRGEDPLNVRLDSVPQQIFEDGGSAELNGALEALPSFLTLKSPIYIIETEDETGQADVEVVIPNESEPYHTLDLYGWYPDEERWRFVPGHVDTTAGVIRFEDLPPTVAVFQTQALSPLLGTTLEESQQLDANIAASLNLVMPAGVTVSGDGLLSGAPVGGWSPAAGYAVAPVVRASDPNALSQILNNEAERALLVEDLREMVASSGYNGVAIDFNIAGSDRDAFSTFVEELDAEFDTINRVVVVYVPQPQPNGEGWETGGYDLRAIGRVADVVALSGGDIPANYAAGGSALNMLQWAVGEVNRRKLYVVSSTYSYDAGAGALVSYHTAVEPLGEINVLTDLPEDAESYEPGNEIEMEMTGNVSDVAVDDSTGATVYSIDGQQMWIVTANAVRKRLDRLATFHLGGMILRDLGGSENDAALAQALTEFKVQNESSISGELSMGWTVIGPDGVARTEYVGIATPWAWIPEDSGDYEIAASLWGSDVIELDKQSVRVAEVTPEPTPTPRATQAPVTSNPEPTEPPATSAPATSAPPPSTGGSGSDGGGFALGGQAPGYVSHPGEMKQAGMSWVKFQIKWSPGMDPGVAAQYINAGHSNGFKVLLSIAGQLYPSSIDFNGYVEFLRGVAALGPDAIEVWNEMNLDREWPTGQINPTSYVNNMLAPAFNAIKSTNPGTLVIIGALAPTGFDNGTNAWSDQRYVQGMAAAGAANYANCIGAHHNSGTTAPSVRSGRSEGDHYSWYFLPTLEVYYYGMGGALPVCITEYGYLTPEGFGSPLPDAFAWAADTTVQEQAAWLAEGANLSRSLGYVRLMIVWNVGFTTWDSDPQAGYSIIRPDGSCPACATLGAAMP